MRQWRQHGECRRNTRTMQRPPPMLTPRPCQPLHLRVSSWCVGDRSDIFLERPCLPWCDHCSLSSKAHLPPSPHRPRDAHTTYVHTFACAGNRASARGVLLFKYGSTLIPSPPYDAIDRTTVTCPDCGVVLTGGMCDACENGDFDSRCGCAGHRPLHSCAAAAVCPDIQFAWGSCAVPVRFTVHK